ncbi:MAG: lamin tail domain-containing protein, partial [Bacteroidetes bacterium]|nr:lamin tail domain-containing protein [Bacteroidota bacterium]
MKKTFTFLMLGVLLVVPFLLRSQNLVITEIMYNDPSGGTTGDSLEFIEVYNSDIAAKNVGGYKFTLGITFTFPHMEIPAGGYLIVAKTATAVNNFFGITGTLQWDNGQALSNNGESVVLKDSLGVTVDSVRYFTASPWPGPANGLGSSLMLCDPSLDNNIGANWSASNIINATTYGLVNAVTVYATPLSGCTVPPPYNPVYAALPYTETFDNTWINGDNLRDVPTNNWKNAPNTSDNSWRRNDDGVSAGWSNGTQGAYTPAGAALTANSARFHCAGSATGLQGTLDLYLDFTTAGLKKMTFWYMNSAGTDSLAIWISYDAGVSFTYLQKFLTTTGGWNKKTLYLGTTIASQVIIRFRATSNFGTSDIGIDQVNIGIASLDDAGIVAIVRPASIIFSIEDTIKVNLVNYGSNNLTSADIVYSVNNGTPVHHPWTGNLSPLDVAGNINLGIYYFPFNGASVLKVWTNLPNGNTDTDPANDTTARVVLYQPRATVPFSENFDSTWVNRLSTHDAPSQYWGNNPATGNNSWRRDDDGTTSGGWTNNNGAYTVPGANGTIHSARFHSAGNAAGVQGIFTLFMDLGSPGYKELRFYYINTLQTDSMAVWISYDGGQNYQYLAKYTTTAVGWELKSIPLGNSTAHYVLIRFRATASNGGNTDIGLDQVTIDQPQPEVGVMKVIHPVSDCGLTATEIVTVKIKNFGNIAVSNIPVSFTVNGGAPVAEFDNITLAAGDTISYTFLGTANLSVLGTHNISAYTSYPGDINPVNDTVKVTITQIEPVAAFPFLEDFEQGNSPFFAFNKGVNAGIGIEAGIGNQNSFGLRMTGNVAGNWPSGSGNNTTAAQAWGTYTDHHAVAMTCQVNAASLSHPQILLDLRQNYITNGGPRYSWFRLMVNDTFAAPNQNGLVNFNPASQNGDVYATQVFDLTAFANTSFKLTLQSSCKFNDAYATPGNGDNVFVDNFIIRNKPDIELAIQSMTSPVSSCSLNLEAVTITIKNQGSAAVTNIPVKYTLNNGTSWVTESIATTLNPDSMLTYTFSQLVDLSVVGAYPMKVVVSKFGDADHTNDTLSRVVTSIPFLTLNGAYSEDFENGTGGWSSGMIAVKDEWVLGTPAKPNLNNAHSGINAWVTGLTDNYIDNSESFLLSPCFNFSGMINPFLTVWLDLRTENNYDAMIMEVKVNDSTWYKLTADAGFYNNTSTQGPVAPPKWSGNSNGWQQYTTSLPGLAGKAKVQIRFRFVSDYMTVDEGIAMDDIRIFEPYPDMTVTAITAPVNGCSLTNAENVTATLRNVGFLPADTMLIAYRVDLG